MIKRFTKSYPSTLILPILAVTISIRVIEDEKIFVWKNTALWKVLHMPSLRVQLNV
jgi:hypothetical protein